MAIPPVIPPRSLSSKTPTPYSPQWHRVVSPTIPPTTLSTSPQILVRPGSGSDLTFCPLDSLQPSQISVLGDPPFYPDTPVPRRRTGNFYFVLHPHNSMNMFNGQNIWFRRNQDIHSREPQSSWTGMDINSKKYSPHHPLYEHWRCELFKWPFIYQCVYIHRLQYINPWLNGRRPIVHRFSQTILQLLRKVEFLKMKFSCDQLSHIPYVTSHDKCVTGSSGKTVNRMSVFDSHHIHIFLISRSCNRCCVVSYGWLWDQYDVC